MTARGDSPPAEYINGLSAKEQAHIAREIDLLEDYGVGLRMPHAQPLVGHAPLWELRPLPFRVIYFAHTGRRFILLHVFRKQSDKTPRREIEIAEARRLDFLAREREA